MQPYRTRLCYLLLALLLTGCVSSLPTIEFTHSEPPSSLSGDPLFATAIRLEQNGNFGEAAALFEQLASETKPPVQQQALLRAAEDYLAAGDPDSAFRLLPSIPTNDYPRLEFQKRLVFAETALKRNQADQALQLLEQAPRQDVSSDLLRRYYLARSEAFRLTGNLLESARSQSDLDLLLTDPQQRLQNQKEIIRSLSTYTDGALEMLQPKPPGVFGGWMELARILKVYPNDPQEGQRRLERWRERFSSHPALPDLLEGYFQRIRTLYHPPSHVAVLLPQSGPYAKPAAAIRHGLMAAYYNQRGGNRPELRFYDSAGGRDIWSLYRQAVSDGAELVIGPLRKESVEQLAHGGSLDTPVLALNQVSSQFFSSGNLYQFALAPEDEAQQAAERAWFDGHTTALALTPASDWGERVYNAFKTRWEQLGGTLLEHQTYDPQQHDFSVPIQELLNLRESEERHNSLDRLLRTKTEFEPRRRQDVGFIFLAANWELARQIRPQLQFHHAADVPIYTTSHAYTGIPQPNKDLDLEGIRFPDAPWLLIAGEQEAALAKMLPENLYEYGRLFAMGIDAYRILPHLARLASDEHETLDGKTGILYLDRDGRVHRQLVWAEMKRGQPKVIGYTPRMEEQAPGRAAPTSTFSLFGR
jgi:outer membrane PBP1 activator LpoA protein